MSPQAGTILDRVAGILLTSIAVILLANGFTDLVQAALRNG
jgi:multiple antibiotic resistance protein